MAVAPVLASAREGHRVAVRGRGEGGVPLLLIHGFPCTSLIWPHVVGPPAPPPGSTRSRRTCAATGTRTSRTSHRTGSTTSARSTATWSACSFVAPDGEFVRPAGAAGELTDEWNATGAVLVG